MSTHIVLSEHLKLLIIILVVWSAIWKALALWHAARNNQLAWYIALVVINTTGLLEIIYLVFFRKKKNFNYVNISRL